MSEYKKGVDVPELGFWERLDLPFVRLAVTLNVLFAAATGVFRGKASPKKFKHHVIASAIRKMSERVSYRQQQCVTSELTYKKNQMELTYALTGTSSRRPEMFTGR